VLGLGVLGQAVDEHLELVEPVDAEDAAGVLAIAAGLATVGGAEARIAQRELAGVEDLVRMVGGQRHLGGADQVHVVALQAVDILCGLAEEAGAFHCARLDQGRGNHRPEAPFEGLAQGVLDERELQQRSGAGQEVEPRAGDLGAALHVDAADDLADLQMIAHLDALGLEVARSAVGLDDVQIILTAGRHTVDDDIAEALHHLREAGLGGVHLKLKRLDLAGQLLGASQQRSLLVPLGTRHLRAQRLLLGAGGLESTDRGAARLVGFNRGVHQLHGLSTSPLRTAKTVGIGAQHLWVDHGPKPSEAVRRDGQ